MKSRYARQLWSCPSRLLVGGKLSIKPSILAFVLIICVLPSLLLLLWRVIVRVQFGRLDIDVDLSIVVLVVRRRRSSIAYVSVIAVEHCLQCGGIAAVEAGGETFKAVKGVSRAGHQFQCDWDAVLRRRGRRCQAPRNGVESWNRSTPIFTKECGDVEESVKTANVGQKQLQQRAGRAGGTQDSRRG